MSNNTTGITILWDALRLALKDMIALLPSIFLSLVIVLLYILLIIAVNNILRKILTVLRVDELAKPLIRRFYVRLSTLIIFLTDLGIAILAGYTIILAIAPQYISGANYILYYTGRIVSIIFIILLTFLFVNAIVGYIRVEAKLRGFMFLLILFISITLVIDIAQLSEEVKTALAWGISIGIAALITVFSIWFFFHELIEAKIARSSSSG
jgi:hypothetical protein